MRVRVLRSFVATIPSPRESRQRKVRGVKGEIISMPPGMDWIKAGLVIPADGEKMPPAPLPIGRIDFEEEDDDDDGEDQDFKFKKVQKIEEAVVKVPEKAVTRSKSRSRSKPKSATTSQTAAKKTQGNASKRK